MKHNVFGRKLGRTIDERRRLFMQLTRSLITLGRIKTTYAKAKAVQPSVDKLITKAKDGSSSAMAELRKQLASEPVVSELLRMAKTRFSVRTSGYTRIIKLGKRRGDAAEEVIIEFVDVEPAKAEVVKKKETKEEVKAEEAKVVAPKKTKKTKKA